MTAPEIRRKKYGASRQPPDNIQISAAEYFSAELMTPLDLLHVHTCNIPF